MWKHTTTITMNVVSKKVMAWYESLSECGRDRLNYGLYYLIVVGSGAAAFGYTINLLTTDEIWETGGDDIAEKEKRRGQFTSMTSMLSLGLYNMAIDANAGINGYTSAATMSILAGNVTGYVLDAAIAGQDGWSKAKKNMNYAGCFKHGFASLLTSNFARYILTILFDMHISSVFVQGLKQWSAVKAVDNLPPWKTFLPTFLSVIASMTTFYSYTNDTRFRFAIRNSEKKTSKDENEEEDDSGAQNKPKEYIDSFTFFALVSIAAVVYLHIEVDENQGAHAPNSKVFNAIVTFGLMVALSMGGYLETASKVKVGDWWKGYLGYACYIAALVYGTFQTKASLKAEDVLQWKLTEPQWKHVLPKTLSDGIRNIDELGCKDFWGKTKVKGSILFDAIKNKKLKINANDFSKVKQASEAAMYLNDRGLNVNDLNLSESNYNAKVVMIGLTTLALVVPMLLLATVEDYTAIVALSTFVVLAGVSILMYRQKGNVWDPSKGHRWRTA